MLAFVDEAFAKSRVVVPEAWIADSPFLDVASIDTDSVLLGVGVPKDWTEASAYLDVVLLNIDSVLFGEISARERAKSMNRDVAKDKLAEICMIIWKWHSKEARRKTVATKVEKIREATGIEVSEADICGRGCCERRS